ncbi:MAG TPA: 2-dehydro-3-deoxygalactonokinase [Planctomycetota bacterium]|nr:2-dehydro-3-deoxygalactonokinase [Planctomycetota bacterium]
MRFVGGDWGTSNFRLRFVDGKVKREFKSDEGTAKLAAAGGERARAFRETLASGLAKLQAPKNIPVVLSGMASSSIGWKELPYAKAPFALDGRSAVWAKVDPHVYLISGMRTDTEILRGEETEAIGLVAALGREMPFEAVLVLPGTHSKHLDVNPGGIAGFRTFMTGELFDLLVRLSVLRHSTDPDAPVDKTAFLDGVEESTARPVTSALFRVRTRQVLDRKGAGSNTSFLSGLLIGTELGTLRGSDVAIILAAGKALRGSYTAAAEALGLGPRLKTVDSEPLSVLGQQVLLKRIHSGK